MKVRAALLSAPAASGEGLFLRMEELDESELTECHLPTVDACDLPPNRYRWIPTGMYGQVAAPYGGAMVEKRIVILALTFNLSILEATAKFLKMGGV